jgi:hypothetical protein
VGQLRRKAATKSIKLRTRKFNPHQSTNKNNKSKSKPGQTNPNPIRKWRQQDKTNILIFPGLFEDEVGSLDPSFGCVTDDSLPIGPKVQWRSADVSSSSYQTSHHAVKGAVAILVAPGTCLQDLEASMRQETE